MVKLFPFAIPNNNFHSAYDCITLYIVITRFVKILRWYITIIYDNNYYYCS